ncbi:MAG: alpha/beta hydrolase [Acidimicrobiia bacterium]
MRRWIPCVVISILAACTPGESDQPATTIDTSLTGSTTAGPSTTAAPRPSTAELLRRRDAQPCEDSDFTCLTIDMPLDHAAPGDGETVGVTFAVLPASREPKGVLVTVVGGPGGSGIAVADSYTAALDPRITDSFDLVYWDPRGVARSGGLDCPKAAAAYYRVDVLSGLGVDHESLASSSETFASDCVAEMGRTDLLPYLGTDQSVADLETFREILGYPELTIYGESYGTQVAQEYTARFGDHVAALILDGTVDLTLGPFQFFEQQVAAFRSVLDQTLEYCSTDPACEGDMTDPASVVYDRLASLLVEGPLTTGFPTAGGDMEQRSFGVGDLELVASAQVYGEDDRMFLLRALAAYDRGDMVPLLRLLYANLGSDPDAGPVEPDPSYSDAMYYGVECLDYHFPGETPEEKADAFFEAGAEIERGRLGSLFYGDLPCAYWPVNRTDPIRPEALIATGIPTLVLDASADPATPYQQGLAVYQGLDEGYLISKAGGPHVIFGRGNSCPDDAVTAFILDGTPPSVTVCDGAVVGDYVPLPPKSAGDISDLETLIDVIENEIIYTPEYYWWDGFTEVTTGCDKGGTFTFEGDDHGDTYRYDFCVLTDDLVVDGSGSYDYDNDVFDLDVSLGPADCRYLLSRDGGDYSWQDNCPNDFFDG